MNEMITLDEMLGEYFSTRDDGGCHFDLRNEQDFYHFESFLIDKGYSEHFDKKKLQEIYNLTSEDFSSDIKNVWEKVKRLVTSGMEVVTRKFSNYSDRIRGSIGDKELDQTFEITIPYIEEPNIIDFSKLITPEISPESEISDEPRNNTDDDQSSVEAIPDGDVENIKEGAVEAIKGYYNESLTCLNIIKKHGHSINVNLLYESPSVEKNDEMIVVNLDNPNGGSVKKIIDEVNRYNLLLKQVSGKKYEELLSIIQIASDNMSDHLINEVGLSGGVIREVILTGKTEISKGVSHKADIRLKITKNSIQSYKAYSLKMYSSKTLNLANLGGRGAVGKLTDEATNETFLLELEKNEDYKIYKLAYRKVETLKNQFQSNKIDVKTLISGLSLIRVPNDIKIKKSIDDQIERINKSEQSKDAIVDNLREIRRIIGFPMNPIYSQYVYEAIKNYIQNIDNKQNFCKNLLDILGFSDKDTDILLSIVGPKQVNQRKSEIITKHPELNLDNVDVTYKPGTVTIDVINTVNKKSLIKFTAKEGASVLFGTVKF